MIIVVHRKGGKHGEAPGRGRGTLRSRPVAIRAPTDATKSVNARTRGEQPCNIAGMG
jgi:hypothetical protein